jgi:transcriptional regulator with GAF, ATPase, and Fis domain
VDFIGLDHQAQAQWRAALSASVSLLECDANAGMPALVVWDGRDLDAALEMLRERSLCAARRVLLLCTGPAPSTAVTWQLVHCGAADVLICTNQAAQLQQAVWRLERWQAVERILQSALVRETLVGDSRAWRAMLRHVIEIAAFSQGSILLLGESGTGKELIARLVHTLDARPHKTELIVLDCTTVVPELAGSEFFGHERGAFTGASAARDGAFSQAHGGTLFLDEVGELPLGMQAQLLRAVQEQTSKRVGGNTWLRSEFRLLCATNRDLSVEVERGGFRRDFFHRIASRVVHVPALRERSEDILRLAKHFLRELNPQLEPVLSTSVAEFLVARAYPGNVRELRQLVACMTDRHVGVGPITPGALPVHELSQAPAPASWPDAGFERGIERALSLGTGLRDIGRIATETAIRLAVAAEQGNVQRAARRLGVTDRALQMRRAQAAR